MDRGRPKSVHGPKVHGGSGEPIELVIMAFTQTRHRPTTPWTRFGNKSIETLVELMTNSPQVLTSALELMLIARHLERIGDHATRMCSSWLLVRMSGTRCSATSPAKGKTGPTPAQVAERGGLAGLACRRQSRRRVDNPTDVPAASRFRLCALVLCQRSPLSADW